MAHELKVALLLLLAVFIPFGLFIRQASRAIKQADMPEPEILVYYPSFWNQYTFYVLFPFLLLGMGPVVTAYMALTRLDGSMFLLTLLFAIPWLPFTLLFWIYCSYWRHDQYCMLRVFPREKKFEYSNCQVVSTYSYSDVVSLTCYRSKKNRTGEYIFYTQVELADGQSLLVTCLLGSFQFVKPAPAAGQQTIARWFPWLPGRA